MGLLAQYRTGQIMGFTSAEAGSANVPSGGGGGEATARQWVIAGFKSQFGRDPTLLEAQFIQGVARLETGYGHWKDEGAGSNNMGAVQAGSPPCNPATSFGHKDSHPNASGGSHYYDACFRKYPSPEAGMADVARLLYAQMKINPTSIRAVSTGMYDHHYYEGFGKDRAARIDNHVKALTKNLQAITSALNEPMPPTGDGMFGGVSKTGVAVGVVVVAGLGLLAYKVFL